MSKCRECVHRGHTLLVQTRWTTAARLLVRVVDVQVVQAGDGDDVLSGMPRVVQHLLREVKRVDVKVTGSDSGAKWTGGRWAGSDL